MNNLGKIPPQAIELEEAVLGSLLISSDAVELINKLEPGYFYSDRNKKIFEAILSLKERKGKVDILTVKEELTRKKILDEVGGALYLTTLTGRIATSVHFEFHSAILEQKFIQRELIRYTEEINREAFDDEIDIDDIIEKYKKNYDNLVNVLSKHTKTNTLLGAVESLRDRIEIRKERFKDGKIEGVTFGIKGLDAYTFGAKPGEVIIVGARPSIGKTAFVLKVIKEEIDLDIPVAFFSLEMTQIALMDRLVLSYSQLRPDFYRSGNINEREQEIIDRSLDEILSKNLYIDDRSSLRPSDMNAVVRGLVNENRCKIVFIDYLQLIKLKEDNKNLNRNHQVGDVMKQLKAMAKDNKVPVVILCQLNREVTRRGGSRRPILSDLRDSGEIEQDADMVMFLHRDDYYDPEAPAGMEVIIAKSRDGALGTVVLGYRDKSLSILYEGTTEPQEEDFPINNKQLPYVEF